MSQRNVAKKVYNGAWHKTGTLTFHAELVRKKRNKKKNSVCMLCCFNLHHLKTLKNLHTTEGEPFFPYKHSRVVISCSHHHQHAFHLHSFSFFPSSFFCYFHSFSLTLSASQWPVNFCYLWKGATLWFCVCTVPHCWVSLSFAFLWRLELA